MVRCQSCLHSTQSRGFQSMLLTAIGLQVTKWSGQFFHIKLPASHLSQALLPRTSPENFIPLLSFARYCRFAFTLPLAISFQWVWVTCCSLCLTTDHAGYSSLDRLRRTNAVEFAARSARRPPSDPGEFGPATTNRPTHGHRVS